MQRLTRLSLALAGCFAGLSMTAAPVMADSVDAHCTLYQNGQQKEHGTGKCNFYQAQGNIVLTLKDGKEYPLRQGEMSGEYFDVDQKSVMRSINDKNWLIFKWPHQEIVVNQNAGALGGGDNHVDTGGTPDEFKSMIGKDGGTNGDELAYRGYEMKNYQESGDDIYSNWENQESGTCITVRSTNGIYRSVVYSTPFDCGRK